jgi:hypothetical protein
VRRSGTLATLVLLHTTAGRSLWTGFSFDNSSNSRVSILIMAMVSLQKELCRRFLPILTTKSISATASATKATPKLGKPKKGDPFPKTKRAYLFIVKQIKHGLSIILHQTLDKLQLEHLSGRMGECTNLYHHQHNKEQLEKRFLGTG